MIWLNQAATSFPKPPEVYEARDKYFRMGIAGHNRGLGKNDLLAKQLASRCKGLLAEMFGANPAQVFFTAGATEALNIVFANMPPGIEVVSTKARHNAVRRSIAAYGFTEKLLPPLDIENYQELLKKALGPDSLLVLNACSNVNGRSEPIEQICAFIRRNYPHVKIAVDGAQAAGHSPINIGWGIDYLALTAHKGLYGPAGLGALISPLPLHPLIFGGTGERSRTLVQNTEDGMFEAGTRDGASIGAWAEGLAFVQKIGLDAINAHENNLKQAFMESIAALPLRLWTGEGPVVSLEAAEFASEELAALLEAEGIAVRGGMHCAPDMHDFLGTKGAVRFSFGWFNTQQEVARAAEVLKSILGGME